MLPSPAVTPKASAKRKAKGKTWEHPVGSGIKISELPNKTGGKVFGVSYRVRIPGKLLGRAGVRETVQCKTQPEAERLAEDRLLALRAYGTSFADLPAPAQKEAAIAYGMLKEHGLSFVESAKAAIAALRPPGGQRTLSQVLAELRESKESRFKRGELDERTSEDFKSRSLKIEAALGPKLVSTVTGDDLTTWLKKLRSDGPSGKKPRPYSQRSILNFRNTLAEVFRHAKARRYCSTNPFDGFTREDYRSLGGNHAEPSADGIVNARE